MYNKLRKGGMLPSAGQEITNPSGGKGKTQSKGRHDPTKPKSRNLDIYLVFLVRLRQGTVHPYLLEPVINKTLIPEDIERIQNGLAKLKGKSSIGDMLKSLPPTTTPFDLDQELEVALADKELTICCFCDNEASNPQTAEVSRCSAYQVPFLTRVNSARMCYVTAASMGRFLWPANPICRSPDALNAINQ